MKSDFQPENADEMLSCLQSGADCGLNLADLDIEDGLQMAELVRAIKVFLETGRRLRLEQPSQMLVHNIYRVGLLGHPSLTIHNTRMDEPHAG